MKSSRSEQGPEIGGGVVGIGAVDVDVDVGTGEVLVGTGLVGTGAVLVAVGTGVTVPVGTGDVGTGVDVSLVVGTGLGGTVPVGAPTIVKVSPPPMSFDDQSDSSVSEAPHAMALTAQAEELHNASKRDRDRACTDGLVT